MRTSPIIATAAPRKPSTFNLEGPGDAENGPTDLANVALTVTSLRAVLQGTSSPSVTWTVRFGPIRNVGGTEIVVNGTTTTSVTTGDTITVLDNALIPADNWIWARTTAESGVVVDLIISVVYA